MNIKRGQVWFVDLEGAIGREQQRARPAVIVSNDIGNRFSPIVIVAPCTTQIQKKRLDTQVILNSLSAPSMVMCEQIRAVDKSRLKKYLCTLTENEVAQINKALKITIEV